MSVTKIRQIRPNVHLAKWAKILLLDNLWKVCMQIYIMMLSYYTIMSCLTKHSIYYHESYCFLRQVICNDVALLRTINLGQFNWPNANEENKNKREKDNKCMYVVVLNIYQSEYNYSCQSEHINYTLKYATRVHVVVFCCFADWQKLYIIVAYYNYGLTWDMLTLFQFNYSIDSGTRITRFIQWMM